LTRPARGLNITELEADEDLQDAVLSVFVL
jgi:hypothetical protein